MKSIGIRRLTVSKIPSFTKELGTPVHPLSSHVNVPTLAYRRLIEGGQLYCRRLALKGRPTKQFRYE